jgi:CRP-like cAMP-binding protein
LANQWLTALRATPQAEALPVDQLSVFSSLLRPWVFSAGDVVAEDLSNAPCIGIIQRGVVTAWLEHPGSVSVGLMALAKGAMVGTMVAGRENGSGRVLRVQETTVIQALTCEAMARLEKTAPTVFTAVMRVLFDRTSQQHQDLLRSVAAKLRERNPRMSRVGGDEPMFADVAGRYHGQPGLLNRSPFLALDDHALVALSAVAPLRQWGDRRVLVGDGQTGSSVLLIARGKVDLLPRVRGRRRRLATVGPGIAIEAGPVLQGRQHMMSYRARGDVVAYDLHRTVYERLEEKGGPLVLALAKELAVGAARLSHALHEAMVRLSGLHVKTRFLTPISTRHPTRAAADAPTTAPIGPRSSNVVRTIMDDLEISTEELDRMEVAVPEGVMKATEIVGRLRRA